MSSPKPHRELGVKWTWWHIGVIPTFRRQGQEDLYEFKASQGSLVRAHLRNKTQAKSRNSKIKQQQKQQQQKSGVAIFACSSSAGEVDAGRSLQLIGQLATPTW